MYEEYNNLTINLGYCEEVAEELGEGGGGGGGGELES